MRRRRRATRAARACSSVENSGARGRAAGVAARGSAAENAAFRGAAGLFCTRTCPRRGTRRGCALAGAARAPPETGGRGAAPPAARCGDGAASPSLRVCGERGGLLCAVPAAAPRERECAAQRRWCAEQSRRHVVHRAGFFAGKSWEGRVLRDVELFCLA